MSLKAQSNSHHMKLRERPNLIQSEGKHFLNFQMTKTLKKYYAKASESAGKPNCHILLEKMVKIW